MLCHTYQHVEYIGQALAGFLAQRTDFPFEVVVVDDASTDGTAEIVADHAARYPGVVRAVLHDRNQWSIRRAGGTPLPRPDLHGEFVAPCEGDDYWTDPLKIAQQVALLRSRPDCAVSHHDAVVVRDGIITSTSQLEPRRWDRDLTARELRTGRALPMRTMMYRNHPDLFGPEVDRYRKYVWMGDRFLTARLGLLGGAAFAAGVGPAVRRLHEGGVTTQLRQNRFESAVTLTASSMAIAAYMIDHGDDEAATAHLVRAARFAVMKDLDRGFDPRAAVAADLARRATIPIGRTSPSFVRRWVRVIPRQVCRIIRRARSVLHVER